MKNAVKYICALLLLVGVNVSAWGEASINGSISSKLIEVDDDHAEGYFTFTVSSTNVEADPSGKYLNVYVDAPNTDGSTYYWDCGFGTTEEEVGDGYFQCSSTSGTVGVYYWFNAEGDYSFTVTVWGYDNAASYDAIYYEVPVTVKVHKSCTDRTLSFANATITKDFGTAASKFQDYTLSAGSGTITWSSDDPSIASVNSSGVVTIHKAGSTYINVAVAADGTYCAEEDFYEIIVNALTPVVSSTETGKELTVSGITSTGATFSGGVVTSKGNATITRYGFVIGTSATVVVSGEGINAPVAGSYWSEVIALNTAFGSKTATTSFSPSTTYYVRAFAYNGSIYGYSTAVPFTTLAEYDIDLNKNNSEAGSEDGLATVVQNATSLKEILHATNTNTTGYHLDGYYTNDATPVKVLDADGSFAATNVTGYITDGHWSGTSDITLYAHWAANTYTVSFDANGGSGSMGDVEQDYGSSYALPECSFAAPAGKVFDHWAEGLASGTSRAVGYSHTVSGNITFYAVWRDASFTDYVFSCAELTLTPKLVTSGTPVFITSAASKTVRSQDSILIVGSGLTPGQTLTFPDLPAKFEIKSRTGAALATDASGAIDAVAYIFYTPAVGDTDDGLDEIAGITVQVEGAKPKTVNLTQDIIGRHLPAEFVIAGKWGKAWYALPANMTETATEGNNPTPVLIAVNDADAPTAAYCANTNAYNLVPIGGTGTERFKANGDKVYLGMVNNGNYALFGSGHAAAGAENTNIGRSSGLTTSVDGLGSSYQWNLVQKTADVSTTADVVYNLKIANGNTNSPLKISRGQGKWGLYTSGISEIRLLPLHEIADLDMRVEEWGSNKIAVHLGSTGTIEKVMIDDEEVASPALSSIGGDIYEISGLTGLATSPMSQFVVQMTVGSQLQQKIVQVPFIVTSSDATTIGLRSRSGGGSQEARNEEIKTVDVVVCDGGTLTVNTLEGEGTACTFNNLYIYPGGKVNVNGNTLNVQNIYLRGGFSWLTGRNGESSYKHPQLLVAADKTISGTGSTGHGIFYDLYLTGDQWYLMALPKDVAMSAVRNENGEVPTTSNAWVATYSGLGRTMQPRQQGWTDQEDFASLTFRRGVGYEIAADPVISGRPFSTLRFPLQGAWSAETDCSPTVNSWGITKYNSGTLTANHVGWNLVGNPFYTAYQTSGSGIVAWGLKEHLDAGGNWTGAYDWDKEDGDNVKYYTIPNKTDYGYSDSRAASTKLDAFFPFYVQVQLSNEDDGALSFAAATERTLKAPAMYQTSQQEREVIIDFTLSNENSICTSGLNISDAYTADFDMNDKEASITQGVHELKIYTLVGGIRAAFNSLPEASLGTIPLGYKTTTAGTHFISLVETGDLKQIQSATLIDHEAGELEWDLLQGTYAFETTKQASGNDTRFTMRFALKDESVATGINNSCLFDNLFAIGYDSKIVLHGVPEGADVWVYDMTGKLIGMRRNVTTEYLDVSVPAQGVYNIRVATENGSQTIRTLTK